MEVTVQYFNTTNQGPIDSTRDGISTNKLWKYGAGCRVCRGLGFMIWFWTDLDIYINWTQIELGVSRSDFRGKFIWIEISLSTLKLNLYNSTGLKLNRVLTRIELKSNRVRLGFELECKLEFWMNGRIGSNLRGALRKSFTKTRLLHMALARIGGCGWLGFGSAPRGVALPVPSSDGNNDTIAVLHGCKFWFVPIKIL